MSTTSRLKHILFGKPIATKKAHHEKLLIPFGLAIFASDALSSVAYASEEILIVLKDAGPMGLAQLTPISLWLAILMVVVGFSYYQTIHAYPKGGGTYLVSTENLGSKAGRVAGASLLIDYVLTVAVSISSGVAAVISMFPPAQHYAIAIGCGAVALLCLANLRGAKESGLLFFIPTMTFVVMVLLLVGKAVYMSLTDGVVHTPDITAPPNGFLPITALLLLRAFAASCTALTGTEAIADGVQAFKAPEATNAARTLVLMIVLLITMFVGISYSAQHFGIVPIPAGTIGYKTVVAQLTEVTFGQGWFFFGLLGATAAILFLAANTAFADFPRLSSFVARDGYLPRQLATLGDRLVYQNGVILLSLAAMALIVIFKADTHSLIPLYAMGVFISFTLSQAGMTVKFMRERRGLQERQEDVRKLGLNAMEKKSGRIRTGLLYKILISGFGTIVTGVVTLILLITKFTEGAWLIVVALGVFLLIFRGIRGHYDYLAKELNLRPDDTLPKMKAASLLLVPRVHQGILKAVAYAKVSAKDCRALHVTLDQASVGKVKEDWAKFGADMPLVILESQYRSLIDPVTDYIDEMIRDEPDLLITVIVPQAIPKYWWQGLLHTNAAVPLKLALGSRKNVVITNVRYFIK